jgi:hypothetical protein
VAQARGLRWLCLVSLECTIAAICGVGLYLAVGGSGLPRVSEPFDRTEFEALGISPDKDAWVHLARAIAVFKRLENTRPQDYRPGWRIVAHTSDPGVARSLQANQESLDLFLQASRKSDAFTPRTDSARTPRPREDSVVDVARLMFELGASREKKGDMTGAWEDYLAILRASRLVARHADLNGRRTAEQIRALGLSRLIDWANDPRTDEALIRRAIQDVISLDRLAPDDAYTIKTIYLSLAPAVGSSRIYRADAFTPRPNAGLAELASLGLNFAVFPLRRFHAREPDRSQRVLRASVAQWIDYFETPPPDRPQPEVRVRIGRNSSPRSPWIGVEFYRPSNEYEALDLPSAFDVAEAFAGSYDLRDQIGFRWTALKDIRRREQSDLNTLRLNLAQALYRRDHNGADPPDDDALVGPYLTGLPPEPISLADDPTPEIESDH